MDAAATSLRTAIAPPRRLPGVAMWQFIGLVSLGALAIRAIGLGIRPLWLDEAYSWWFSARDLLLDALPD